ncbi:hypothetical protein [Paracidovorax sp. MALMAid1276]|uniref:hypothetical protein n=1 Tax=Paracidovorax sp. MALMAid1276 TaxID=3411631 RepID=UPI003B9B9059
MKSTALFLAALAGLAALALPAHTTHAQTLCNSDGVPRPTAVFERFIHADCAACWSAANPPAPSPTPSTAVLDWIVPSAAGDDAPLSAAATTDAQQRLQALGRTLRSGTDVHIATVEPMAAKGGAPARLRVARGLAFNDYLGTAIEFAPARKAASSRASDASGASGAAWTYTLVLAEEVPAGTEGTAVARQLVRNVLQGQWRADEPRTTRSAWAAWMETRSMRIPEGAKVDRLNMVGWVQDAEGRIVAAAQSVCR